MEDKTPEGERQQAALPSGEVFDEYGIVDLNATFPSENYEWEPEHPELEKQEHLVVPFRVVKRGFSSLRNAREEAEKMAKDEPGSFKAVQLSDMRGL